jgi:hypothetical protein
MNVEDLKKQIAEIPYDSCIVSFNEGYKIGGYNIDCVHGIWRYYFVDERQNYSEEKRFFSEDSLCQYVLLQVQTNFQRYENALKKKSEEKKREQIETDKVILL